MVYTANWGIIFYLPPFTGTKNNHWSEQGSPFGTAQGEYFKSEEVSNGGNDLDVPDRKFW